MSSAKIVVLSLKEILRVLLFVVCGLFIIILLVFFILPKDDEDVYNDTSASEVGVYKNGEYVSRIDISKGLSSVKVTVEDNNIVDISIYEKDDLAKSFYPLLDPVCEDINDKVLLDNTIDIETDYNNQFTTLVLQNAINNALSEATN